MKIKIFFLFIFFHILINFNNLNAQETSKQVIIYQTNFEKEICLEFPELVDIKEYKIINLLGDIVYKSLNEYSSIKKLYVNISTLKPGIYFFVINTNKSIYTAKFVKK